MAAHRRPPIPRHLGAGLDAAHRDVHVPDDIRPARHHVLVPRQPAPSSTSRPGYTFALKVKPLDDSATLITKTAGITGDAGTGTENDGTPNLTVSWAAGELGDVDRRHHLQGVPHPHADGGRPRLRTARVPARHGNGAVNRAAVAARRRPGALRARGTGRAGRQAATQTAELPPDQDLHDDDHHRTVDHDDDDVPGGCPGLKTIFEGEAWGYYEPDGSLYLIHNNSWNDTAGGDSVITACDYDDWYLISDTPDHADLSVQTYPNVHRDYNNIPLSSISSARFAATGPHCAGLYLEHGVRHLGR